MDCSDGTYDLDYGPDGWQLLIHEHAIEMFIVRHVPDWSFAQALAYLKKDIFNSEMLDFRTHKGNRLWRLAGDIPALLVIKSDRFSSCNLIITILPKNAFENKLYLQEDKFFSENVVVSKVWKKLEKKISAPQLLVPSNKATEKESKKAEKEIKRYEKVKALLEKKEQERREALYADWIKAKQE